MGGGREESQSAMAQTRGEGSAVVFNGRGALSLGGRIRCDGAADVLKGSEKEWAFIGKWCEENLVRELRWNL